MDVQPMLTRDLVLRVCANSTEFDEGWTAAESKVVVPFLAPRDTALIDAVVAAAADVGVNRLLICRTRAEFAYEPVTDAPANTAGIVDVIRGWGDEPTDVLIVVEDLSAAVIITAEELTVAAGPDDFVRAFVGADIPEARAEFGEQARLGRDPELLRAAQRYGCLEIGGRHARGNRGPGPDTAERLAERAHAFREGSPRAVRALRALRGAAGWLMVVALIAAAVAVPGVGAAVPVALGMLWLLIQLAVPARSRTVGFATLLRVAALGAIAVWPVAFAEQAVLGALGPGTPDWVGPTYVAVPVEEAGKLAPLLLVWLFARRRVKRMSAADHLLLGAAAGAGFHLAERGLFAAAAGTVPGTDHYGLFTLLPGWSEVQATGTVFAGHAVTTALIAGAFGVLAVGRRHYGFWLWLLPPAAVALAAIDHMHYNADLAGVELAPATAFFAALTGNGALARWLLLLLLAGAVLMDYRLARLTAETTPPLPGAEPLAGLRRAALGGAVRARVRVPGDIAPVFRRTALAWIRLPTTLACGLSAMVHEFAVQVAAARRGPAALFAAWRLLRWRRAHAMGAVRAGGRPWRRHPARERLEATRLLLEPARPGAAVGAVGTAAALVAAVPPAVPGRLPGVPGEPGYALAALQTGIAWFDGLPAGSQAWAAAAGAALFVLAATGWSVPWSPPDARALLRRPGAEAVVLLGSAAPGQLGYGAVALLGTALPAAASRVLGPSPAGRIKRPGDAA